MYCYRKVQKFRDNFMIF